MLLVIGFITQHAWSKQTARTKAIHYSLHVLGGAAPRLVMFSLQVAVTPGCPREKGRSTASTNSASQSFYETTMPPHYFFSPQTFIYIGKLSSKRKHLRKIDVITLLHMAAFIKSSEPEVVLPNSLFENTIHPRTRYVDM